jgi:NAD(P)-dependent dehydrogenase (short-subunit alcohol dehydrogenase family)
LTLGGRKVIVSGGTSGIGEATARRLAGDGASVWILGSSSRSVQAALGRLSDTVTGGCACDVSDEAAVERVVAEAHEALGGIDGAFVNAGIDGAGDGVLELAARHFRRVLEVNVLGAFLVARAAARAMPAGSAIVVNASVNGLRPERAFADYNASKAAAISLAQTMALELSERGITVTAICPGYVHTPMTERYLDDPDTAAELLAAIPAARFGRPEEVAGLVSFLLSADAAYMGGAVISIDGGRGV